MDDDLVDTDVEHVQGDDDREIEASERLVQVFEENRERVMFGRQLEVWFEKTWFHWITNRALRELDGDVARLERRTLDNGSPVTLCWHHSYRYPKRAANRAMELLNSYSNHVVGQALGERGELLVLEGFARNQFMLHGREMNSFRGRSWTDTNHDLDFVFERDGRVYGVEVKNTLGYLPKSELDIKMALALELELVPVFVCRSLPKTWIHEVNDAGGFCLILQWQLYPRTHRALVDRLREEFELPVDTPRALQDGTMKRFTDWHGTHL